MNHFILSGSCKDNYVFKDNVKSWFFSFSDVFYMIWLSVASSEVLAPLMLILITYNLTQSFLRPPCRQCEGFLFHFLKFISIQVQWSLDE